MHQKGQVAHFYVDWSDLQFRTQIPELGNLSTVTTNLGDLQSYGAEAEFQWQITLIISITALAKTIFSYVVMDLKFRTANSLTRSKPTAQSALTL